MTFSSASNLPWFEQEYLDILDDSLNSKVRKRNRTGVDTSYMFSQQIHCDLSTCFPILSSKKINPRMPLAEFIWMIVKGSSDNRVLAEILTGDPDSKTFWSANAEAPYWTSNPNHSGRSGDLGRIYGKQFREWCTPDGGVVDQVQRVVYILQHDPFSRWMHVSSWNPGELDQMALPPCHVSVTFSVEPNMEGGKNKLNAHMLMRSADIFLGVPFNLVFYAAFVHALCGIVPELTPGTLVTTLVDCHLYDNHRDAAKKQLQQAFELCGGNTPINPNLVLRPRDNINHYELDDFQIVNYTPAAFIAAPMAV